MNDRVLHVVADYGVFSQTFVADAMRELDGVGWEAWLLTRSVSNREQFSFPPSERLLHVAQRPLPLRLLDVARGRQAFFWTPRQTDPALARATPALLHSHFGWSAPDALRVARRAGVPLVCSFHGADVSLFPKLAAWELPRRLLGRENHRLAGVLPHLAAATVPSPVVEEELRALGYAGPVAVLPPGVRLESFPLRSEPPSPEPARLAFVGRLTQRKGVDLLLRAHAEVRRSRPDATLEVCGDGPEREALTALAKRLGLEGSVSLRGVCTREEVQETLLRAHVLVLPSRTMADGEVETLGVVILEALATGVAVVATDSGGIRYALPEELRGELVPEEDPAALAAQVLRVLAEPDPRPRVRAGREWVEREYEWGTLARRTAELYSQVTGAAGPSGGSAPPGRSGADGDRSRRRPGPQGRSR